MRVGDIPRAYTAEDVIRRFNLNGLESDRKAIKTMNNGLTRVNAITREFVNSVLKGISENLLKDQDDNIVTWFFDGVPTLATNPAVNWVNDELKTEHLGDLYYDRQTGYVYRFIKDEEDFKWTREEDSDIVESMAIANAANDADDSMRRIFVEQPTPPYDVGDIWVSDEMYRCRAKRESGSYNQVDWVLASDYSDEDYAKKVVAVVNKYIETITTDHVTKVLLETSIDGINAMVETTATELSNDYNGKINTLRSDWSISDTEIRSEVSRTEERVSDLEGEISNVTGMVQTQDSPTAAVAFNDTTTESEPIILRVYPTSDNISYLYPSTNLYPSDVLYLKVRTIRFVNRTTNEVIDYELPDDLLYYDSEHYDEFYLDYNSQTCQITKKCKYNADGSVGLLDSSRIDDYSNNYPEIILTEGIYSVYILGYSAGYLSVTLMAKNIYTDQFYTKSQTNTKISQSASRLLISVNQTLSNYSTTSQMNTAIEASASSITSMVSQTYATKETTDSLSTRIGQTAKTIELTASDDQTSCGILIKLKNELGEVIDSESANIIMSGLVKFTDLSESGGTEINGENIITGTINANKISGGTISGDLIEGGTIKGSAFKGTTQNSIEMYIGTDSGDQTLPTNNSLILSRNDETLLRIGSRYWNSGSLRQLVFYADTRNFIFKGNQNDSIGTILMSDTIRASIAMESPVFRQTSLENTKKNFKMFNGALDVIKKADVYSYNLITENNNDKKHFGLVIGKNYHTPNELISNNGESIDLYSMTSICLQAIKEQQEIIENLKSKIDCLEREVIK